MVDEAIETNRPATRLTIAAPRTFTSGSRRPTGCWGGVRLNQPVHYQRGAFPPATLNWERLIPLLGPAAAAVARYDGVLAAIANPQVLLGPLTTQEAVLSSRIEGTQATMGEVLEFEANASPPEQPEARKEDIKEVLNYRRALRHAEDELNTLPLSNRVVRSVHRVLLDGVRGQSKAPGEFRRVPNWIGPPGLGVEAARFVPIGAHDLPDAMSTWEAYLHETAPDRLVQLALLHAEFEALHPFLDGNGRLGRILVPLFLWQQGVIRRPMFYISAFLEAHRAEYYEHLLAVSRDGNWTDWCVFFLSAVKEQAEDNLNKAQAILDLYEELKPKVAEWTRSQYGIHALDWFFNRPVFKTPDFIESASIPPATARRLLTRLREETLLREVVPPRGRSPALYTFPRLLNIAEGRRAF